MLARPKHRCRWRLGRLGQMEASTFTYKYYDTLSDTPKIETMQKANSTLLRHASRSANQGNAFSKLSGYETVIERRLLKALHELQHLPPGRQPD
jgi:hypothetical protein